MSSAPSTSVRGPTQKESLVGVMSGGSRALASQFFSFYIRVPIKLFRPARVDYSWMLRKSMGLNQTTKSSGWSDNTIYLLWRAIKMHGLRFVPDRLLPPMIANSVVGAVLYTSYLSSLSIAQFAKGNEYPTLGQALFSGAFAGATQAVVATPLDNLAMRFDAEILKDRDLSLWKYSRDTLWKIGWRAYGGISLNLLKESASFSLFFGTFETVKGPVYRRYRDWWQSPGYFYPEGRPKSRILYPTFILLAGSMAACALQLVNYPLSKIQRLLTLRLQAIDASHVHSQGKSKAGGYGWNYYEQAYQKTFQQIKKLIATEAQNSTLKWLYSGSLRYTLVSMPSTSIGLLVFEILRIRYGNEP